MIYLDNAATTKLSNEALEAMMPFLKEEFGNASALYDLGRKSHAAIEKSRSVIADIINAEPDEIFFTSGGTEADNWAIFGAGKIPDAHIITSKIEHHAVLNSCKALEAQGVKVTYLDVDQEGRINLEELSAAIRPETVLISIMAANNEIGTTQELEEIGRIAHGKEILFHTDAVQAFGKEIIDVKKMNIDYLSASAHKIHGPKGIGFLYMRHGENLLPLIYGGFQERGRRAGTENTAGIVGFAKAAEIAYKNCEEWNKREIFLRDMLIRKLLEIDTCTLNGSKTKRLANNVNVSFAGIEGETLAALLNQHGIAAGTGSACSSGLGLPGHVLKAIGRSHAESFEALRLTLSHENTEHEIEITASCVKKCVEKLRSEKL